MKRILTAIAAAIALAGCTTTSTMELGDGRAVMTTRGNAYATPEQVQRDLYLQASQRALAGGYQWFQIQSAEDVTTTGTAYIPATGNSYASCTGNYCAGRSTYSGPQAIPMTMPGMKVMVQFGSGPRPQGAIDAAQFLALNGKKK